MILTFVEDTVLALTSHGPHGRETEDTGEFEEGQDEEVDVIEERDFDITIQFDDGSVAYDVGKSCFKQYQD